jgi:hypothetical protein
VLDCEFHAAAGQGSMPASLLSKLPKAADTTMTVSVVSRASVDAGGFAIDLVATTSAAAKGKIAMANVVLE